MRISALLTVAVMVPVLLLLDPADAAPQHSMEPAASEVKR